MELNNTEQQRYLAAKKKAGEIRSFYINLMCYCLVVPILAAINLVYSPEFWWFLFSALGWGTGLAFHGIGAFGYSLFFGRQWEDRKVRELLDKEQSKKI